MAFHFPLAGVLRFRKSIEHQEELGLLAANQQVTQTEQRIVEVDERTAASLAREARQLESGLTAAEIQFDVLCRATLARRRLELEEELEQRKKIRDRQLETYRQAKRSREVLDTLRDHQFQLYRQQQLREEQRQLDDLFLLRRERRRG